MESRSPSFFHDHVRHVFVDSTPDQMDDIPRLLALCDAAVNLLLFGGSPNLLSHVEALPLERLSINSPYLSFGSSGPDLSHPAFKTLTHLDLLCLLLK